MLVGPIHQSFREKLKENLRFKDLPCEDSKKSERETLREQIINEFETAKDMILEYELLQMKGTTNPLL